MSFGDVVRCRLLTSTEFDAAEAARIKLAQSRDADKQFAGLHEVLAPGTMWLAHWYHDPSKPDVVDRRDAALKAIREGKHRYYLSRFYWESWADKRPPICVLTPSGEEWCVDARASNGEGWQVTGEPPLITCTPSIQVRRYHGWLRNGEFVDA